MLNELKGLSSIRDMLRWAVSEFNRNNIFYGHGTENPYDEAMALVLHVLALDYSLPESYLDCQITENEKQLIASLIEQRIQSRKPLAYLTNKAYFAGHEFFVNENVLVPRSPIAELIEQAFYPWVEPENVFSVLDLCTGSGCIGIASALALPAANVILSDISEQALSIANINIEHFSLADRVTAIKSDVFAAIPSQQFDLIVSNPPYVSATEYARLPAEYHTEPQIGLTAGEDGMDIVAKILRQAASFLSASGVIIIEVGASAQLLMQRYPQVDFNWIEFEHGGDGVFLLTHQELDQYQSAF